MSQPSSTCGPLHGSRISWRVDPRHLSAEARHELRDAARQPYLELDPGDSDAVEDVVRSSNGRCANSPPRRQRRRHMADRFPMTEFAIGAAARAPRHMRAATEAMGLV